MKKDEQQLRDSLAELSAIHESVPMAMIIVDRDRRVRKVNGFTAMFADRPADEMIGMRGGEALRCLHHLDNPEGCGFGPYCRECRIRKAVEDTFSSGKNFRNIEHWLPFPWGDSYEERCLQISTALLKSGKTEKVLICAQDITDHKRIEEEQRKSKNRLELMAKAAGKLLKAKDPHIVLREICRLVMVEIDCQFFFNYLAETPGGPMRMNAAGGISRSSAAAIHRVEFNGAICEGDAQEVRSVVAENIQSNNDLCTEPARSLGVQAYCRHPLMVRGRCIGTLSFGTQKRPAFTTEEISLMKAICDQVSVAIERHLMERELRQFNETLGLQVAERTAELEETVRKLQKEANERRAAEAQLEKLSKVFMDATDPIVIEDMQHLITDANRAAEKIYGFTREELIGSSVTQLIPAQERRVSLDRRRRCIEEENVQSYEGIRRDRTGKTYPALITAFVLRGPDRLPESIVTITKDISAIKELQQEIQQRAGQLAKLTSELTLAEHRERHRLARTLHDNLQQLLAGAKLKLELLAAGTPLSDNPEMVSARGLILESLQTSQMLATELSPPVLFQQGLPNALKWLTKHMEKTHHLKVTIDAENDADPEQEEIKILLFESVRELLFNVVKHTDKKSATVELSCNTQWVEIKVRDNGPGFDPEKLSEKNFKDSGGLGLFHIRERLQLLGGTFAIESSNENGTTVTITSPLKSNRYAAPEPEAVQTKQSPPATTGSVVSRKNPEANIRVMLVDDHAVMRNGLYAMLSRNPQISVVGEASNGEEAVMMARMLQPDVILMDINMPKMNGIEATRIISSEIRQVRIIGLSMHEAGDQAELMKEAGAVAYHEKNSSSIDLLNAIYKAAGMPHMERTPPTQSSGHGPGARPGLGSERRSGDRRHQTFFNGK